MTSGLSSTLPVHPTGKLEPLDEQLRLWAWGELLEAMPDAIIASDSSGHIVAANRRALELFGYPEDRLVGATVDLLVPDALRSRHARMRESYASKPTPRRLESRAGMQAQRADGTLFDAEISLAPIMTENGRLIVTAIRDISSLLAVKESELASRLEAERERMSARAERARRLESLGLLAGGVAHDFNNLLAVIINYTALVEQQLEENPGELDSQAREDLTEVRRAGERAAKLTRELLTFSRGERRDSSAGTDVGSVIRGALPLLERSVGETVSIETQLEDGALATAIDSSRLEQVLFNLVINARDAMPSGGVIGVEASLVDIDAQYAASRPGLSPGRFVRLSVSDEGAGMSPEVVASAFDPFFTTKLPGKGSGLGLSTVYGIIREAGGDTKIFSEPGVGTTVTVTLPLHTGEAITENEPAASPPTAKHLGLTVLVADDEESLRGATARLLRRAGYEVVEAGDGVEALQAIEDQGSSIDVVLSDVTMPRMTGTQLAERLGEMLPAMPVVLTSGYAQADGADPPGTAGRFAILEKPFGESQLLEAIGEAIGDARRSDRR